MAQQDPDFAGVAPSAPPGHLGHSYGQPPACLPEDPAHGAPSAPPADYFLWFVPQQPRTQVMGQEEPDSPSKVSDAEDSSDSSQWIPSVQLNLLASAMFFVWAFGGVGLWALLKDGWVGTERFAMTGLSAFVPIIVVVAFDMCHLTSRGLYFAAYLWLAAIWSLVVPVFALVWVWERHQKGVTWGIVALRLLGGFAVSCLLFTQLIPFVWQSLVVILQLDRNPPTGCWERLACRLGTSVITGRRRVAANGRPTGCHILAWFDCGDCRWDCHRMLCQRRAPLDWPRPEGKRDGNVFHGRTCPCCDPSSPYSSCVLCTNFGRGVQKGLTGVVKGVGWLTNQCVNVMCCCSDSCPTFQAILFYSILMALMSALFLGFVVGLWLLTDLFVEHVDPGNQPLRVTLLALDAGLALVLLIAFVRAVTKQRRKADTTGPPKDNCDCDSTACWWYGPIAPCPCDCDGSHHHGGGVSRDCTCDCCDDNCCDTCACDCGDCGDVNCDCNC